MSSRSLVVLILGSGANVGDSVARAFAAKGYKVAQASRSIKDETTENGLNVQSDLSKPESVADIFSKVKSSLGLPSVVVYNAAAFTKSEPENPLSLSLDEFTRDLNINTTSAFAAAKHAAESFAQLPESASKTFIYTGNMLNTKAVPSFFTLGLGKSATAHLLDIAAASYADRGFKFYYADERNSDGSPMYKGVSGEEHGKFYVELAESEKQGPWQQTFVKGEGYKKF